jgi:RimJ/RimL family protein N-acetyltransferase
MRGVRRQRIDVDDSCIRRLNIRNVITERLTLRPYRLSDFEDLSVILADPEVMQHVFTGKSFSPADSKNS